jgi:hypothetical protein
MWYVGRRHARDTRIRHRPAAGWALETLETRTLLSSGPAALASSGPGAARTAIPTTTVLLASQTTIETSQLVTFTATVQNANHQTPISSGRVKFVVESPKPRVLAQVPLNKKGEAGITTAKLTNTGAYAIEADYVPGGSQTARSVSNAITLTVTPLTAASFLVTPAQVRGHLGQPMTFSVTALDARKRPMPGYTGTVALSSPTDSWTTFHPAVYASLGVSAPPPQSTGLASFANLTYKFSPADHGVHVFVGGVTFNKGGAEILKVTQANNAKVFGKTTFAIA